jgi:GntR family transcriptional regulator
VQEGLIGRRQGTGTFINQSVAAKRYRAITSISDSILAQGLKAGYRVLQSAPEPAPENARAFFGLPEGAPVYRHVRLVLADNKPVAVANALLNIERLQGLDLSQLDQGLYETIRQWFGRTIVHVEDTYRPVIADAETAKLLDLEQPSAIYTSERRAYDQSGMPLELSTISLVPVALEISIAQIGADLRGEIQPPIVGPWAYRVGLGGFKI